MRHCPDCGDRVESSRSLEGFPRWHCAACGRTHYEGPKVLVWCYAYWRQSIVMCRRAEEPARGLWNPPSGYVEQGESLEAAAARELQEEAGVAVDPGELELFRVVSLPRLNQVFIGFCVALREEPRLVAGPEASEVRLFSERDIPLGELAHRDGIAEEYPADIFAALRAGRIEARATQVPAVHGAKKCRGASRTRVPR